MAEGGKDQQLPGLELTYQQLFFINYAQVGVSSPPLPTPTCPLTHRWEPAPTSYPW